MELFRKEAVRHQTERARFGKVVVIRRLPVTLLTGFFLFIAAALLVFLALGRYTSTVPVPGILIPSAGAARIHAPTSGGVVIAVLVAEGDQITRNDPLIAVSTEHLASKGKEILSLMIDRLRAEAADFRELIAETTRHEKQQQQTISRKSTLLQQQLASLGEQLRIENHRLRLNSDELWRARKLRKNGLLAASHEDRIHLQVLQNASRAEQIRSAIGAVEGQLEGLRSEKEAAESQRVTRLAELRTSLSATKRQILEVEGRRGYVINAPRSGSVTALSVHKGMNLAPGQALASILPPATEFVAQLYIPSKSIAFVQRGQRIGLRMDTFPYQRFGLQPATIISVSQDIVLPGQSALPVVVDQPTYPVTARLDRQFVSAFGQHMPLKSGMQLQADIPRHRTRILDWFLDPILSFRGAL